MSQQNGYICVEHDAQQDSNDCINIIVVFQNETTLQDWAAHPEHDDLVNALDPYRSRHYWEVAIVDYEKFVPTTPIWERIEAITHF
ncbi:hypothetical protein [Candidatus Berkiella aquae]|uniref:Uncharacterized protein n=1 Tax=Candidatus Berkiella aquae TaxID=295108 RepID=A0A0Q9YSI2_9GAMM|nr:hypothetical protein [Candidatus Berkiella aquae]MCS5711799.1 hypothetical protein [Candidatus Berkiella aquae]